MALPKGRYGISQESPKTERPKNPPSGSSAAYKRCNHEFVLLESREFNGYTVDTFYCKFCCEYQSNQRK